MQRRLVKLLNKINKMRYFILSCLAEFEKEEQKKAEKLKEMAKGEYIK